MFLRNATASFLDTNHARWLWVPYYETRCESHVICGEKLKHGMLFFTLSHLGMVHHRALGPREHHKAEAVAGEGLRLTPWQTRLDDVRRHRGQRALHMTINLGKAVVPA